MYIDEVMIDFNEYLNNRYEKIEYLLPSDIIETMSPALYDQLLIGFIADNYKTTDGEHYKRITPEW